jgi:SAM-dependent methyltransferase
MQAEDWDDIADDYFEKISSPFESDVINPLNDEIIRLSDNDKFVCDAGCGVGNLVPLLSDNFGKVLAFDFSSNMVETTKRKASKLENVEVKKKDFLDFDMKNMFDYVFAVNSLIIPSGVKIDKAIAGIFGSLKKNGKMIAVFPALESVLYESMIVNESELEKYDDEKKAAIMTKRCIGKKNYDFFTGIIDIDGKQKHFYKFEVEHRLQKAGFKNIEIKKVLYPWVNIHETILPKSLKGKDVMLWDWFVTAEK